MLAEHEAAVHVGARLVPVGLDPGEVADQAVAIGILEVVVVGAVQVQRFRLQLDPFDAALMLVGAFVVGDAHEHAFALIAR